MRSLTLSIKFRIISENVLQPEERDFNQNIVFGADVTVSQVLDMAKGYPMMAEHRVVIVKGIKICVEQSFRKIFQ